MKKNTMPFYMNIIKTYIKNMGRKKKSSEVSIVLLTLILKIYGLVFSLIMQIRIAVCARPALVISVCAGCPYLH